MFIKNQLKYKEMNKEEKLIHLYENINGGSNGNGE